ncbi:MAG: hypothetical protein QOG49_247 [Frankiaceae bacterium]|jgi:hypothetical protein|nr:hypothetical protein [Frankiaceae bacterium]
MATSRYRLLSAAVLVALGLTGCSSKGSSKAASTPPAATAAAPSAGSGASPCDLLTEAEVATALATEKVTAKLTEHGPPLGGRQCLWSTDTLPIKTYSLTITTSAGIAKALRDAGQTGTTLYENAKKLYADAQALPGIGDEALIAKSTIIARKGDTFISASTFFGTSDAAIAALKSLTTAAVAKL